MAKRPKAADKPLLQTNADSNIRPIRADGWANILTGLGLLERDKRVSAQAQYERLAEMDVEEIYASDDIAARIVDTLPRDMVREWLEYHTDPDLIHVIERSVDALDAQAKFKQALSWARLYGGSGILMLVDDSADLSEELSLDRIRELKSLTVLERYELTVEPDKIDLDIQSPTYGTPLLYRLQSRRGDLPENMRYIHASRILRFDGVKLPLRLQMSNNYWGDSILTRTYNAIRNFNVSHDAAATVLQEFNQAVFKLDNLSQLLANQQDELVLSRLQIMNMARSICRAVVIDSTESFENRSINLTGLPDVLRLIGQRLVTASEMPHTKILGESPSGLGATGDSEKSDWYDYVSNHQETDLRPQLQRFFGVLFASKKGPTGGRTPNPWGFEFRPLQQVDQNEQAQLRFTNSQTDKNYIDSGVLMAEEIAMSRFGSGQYSAETQLDEEVRAAQNPLPPSGDVSGGKPKPSSAP